MTARQTGSVCLLINLQGILGLPEISTGKRVL
jgi:hypothetical protein